MDVLLMVLMVDILHWNEVLAKIIDEILVSCIVAIAALRNELWIYEKYSDSADEQSSAYAY